MSLVKRRVVPPLSDADREANGDVGVTRLERGEIDRVSVIVASNETDYAFVFLAAAVTSLVRHLVAEF